MNKLIITEPTYSDPKIYEIMGNLDTRGLNGY